MNLSDPHMELALAAIAGVGALCGASGPFMWFRIRSLRAEDKSRKKQIDQTIANMGDDRIASAQQEFDRRVDDIREDAEEDRKLAARRYNRLMRAEPFIDKALTYFRRISAAVDRIIVDLVPGGYDAVEKHGVIIPEPPDPPEYDDED